jgi:hypothetical protein
MKLLTKSDLKALQSQDPYHSTGPGRELPASETLVLVKFFTPDSNWTWFAVSASQDPDTLDVQFFGLVSGLERELGYFWLSELESARGPLGLAVERDLYFDPVPLSTLL